MRIYLSAAHSSGKTTLARYISNKYKLPLLPEVARMVASERELQIDALRCDMDLVDSYRSIARKPQGFSLGMNCVI